MKKYTFNCTEYEAKMVDTVLKHPKYKHIRDPKAFFMNAVTKVLGTLK
tara:strand:+ start:448 stop:591 length:144 start_codon:yes stop_codon:yes gene_type:complete